MTKLSNLSRTGWWYFYIYDSGENIVLIDTSIFYSFRCDCWMFSSNTTNMRNWTYWIPCFRCPFFEITDELIFQPWETNNTSGREKQWIAWLRTWWHIISLHSWILLAKTGNGCAPWETDRWCWFLLVPNFYHYHGFDSTEQIVSKECTLQDYGRSRQVKTLGNTAKHVGPGGISYATHISSLASASLRRRRSLPLRPP